MNATYVAKHRAFADYTLRTQPIDIKSGLNYHLTFDGATGIDAPGVLNSSDNTTVYYDNAAYRAALDKPVTFVACCHYPRSLLGATNLLVPTPYSDPTTEQFISHASSGFVVSDNIMGQPVYTNTWTGNDGVQLHADGAWCKPMPRYDIEPYVMPTVRRNVQKEPGVPDIEIRPTVAGVTRRCVGIKLQVTCFSNVFLTQGMVVGGDNKTLYGVAPEVIMHDNASHSYGGTTFFQSTTTTGALETTFQGSQFSQTRKNLGSLVSGQTYESCFIPSGDHILGWQTIPAVTSPLHSCSETFPKITDQQPPDGEHYSLQSWDDFLLNNPCCYLTFAGAPDGTSFRVKTTVAFEYIVLNNNPLSLVRDAARLNRRFQPDWSSLLTCCGASVGSNSCCAEGIAMCSAVRHGAQAAAGVIPKVLGRKPDPSSFTIGAQNSALSIKMMNPAALGPTGDARPADPDDVVEFEDGTYADYFRKMGNIARKAYGYMPSMDSVRTGVNVANAAMGIMGMGSPMLMNGGGMMPPMPPLIR